MSGEGRGAFRKENIGESAGPTHDSTLAPVRDPKNASQVSSQQHHASKTPRPPAPLSAAFPMAVGPTDDGSASKPAGSESAPPAGAAAAKRLPRGIVLGPDGKPYAPPHARRPRPVSNDKQLPHMLLIRLLGRPHQEDNRPRLLHLRRRRRAGRTAARRLPAGRRRAGPLDLDAAAHHGSAVPGAPLAAAAVGRDRPRRRAGRAVPVLVVRR
jgi:hypothetical protein